MLFLDESAFDRWYTKILMAVLACCFLGGVHFGIAGFLGTASSNRSAQAVKSYGQFSLAARRGKVSCRVRPARGWFFPGPDGSAGYVLCHADGSSRGELLTLVSALQDHQYNVLCLTSWPTGRNDGITSFGFHEADEVRAAIDELARRNEVG